MRNGTPLPKLIVKALRRVQPIPPIVPEVTESPLEVEGTLAANPNLLESFETVLSEARDAKKLGSKKEKEELINSLQSVLDLVDNQLEWAAEEQRLNNVLIYVRMGHAVYPHLIAVLRESDVSLSSELSLSWLDRRRAFGAKVSEFLDAFTEQAKGEPAFELIRPDISLWRAATLIDLVSLPMLAPASAQRDEVDQAVEHLNEASESLSNSSQHENAEESYFWRSRLHRHKAMADIKRGCPAAAYMDLTVSGLCARQVRRREQFDELSEELARGYAEVHKVLGHSDQVRKFLENTQYSESEIAGYAADYGEGAPDPVETLPLNFLLVRHSERVTDQERVFGFDGAVTVRGVQEFNYLGRKLRRMISKRKVANLSVYSSKVLESDAVELKSRIAESEDLAIRDVVADVRLNPIDLGCFNGLGEIEAQNRYPGTYRKLQRFRLGQLDGYDLNFRSGESVLEFDRRITDSVCDSLRDLVPVGTPPDQYAEQLDRNWVVFLGHTSSLTAIWNMLTSIGEVKLVYPYYGFEPIETGSIIEIRVDIARRERRGELRRLPGNLRDI